MIDPDTLQKLGRRKEEILSRIRSLQERIWKKYPACLESVSTPRHKTFSISKEVLSMSIASAKEHIPTLEEEIAEELDYPKENIAYYEEVRRSSFSEVGFQGACKEVAQPASAPEDNQPRPRFFGASLDMNIINLDSPKRYSIREASEEPSDLPEQSNAKSPIKDSQFKLDDSDAQDYDKVNAENQSQSKLSEPQEASLANVPSEKVAAPRHSKLLKSDNRLNTAGKSSRSEVSAAKVNTSCGRLVGRDEQSVRKKSDFKSSAKKLDTEVSSPRNYMDKYVGKAQNKSVVVEEFVAVQIGQEARAKMVGRIEQRVIGSMANPEAVKNSKHEKDGLLGAFDLQNKMRDALIKKVLEIQELKKYK